MAGKLLSLAEKIEQKLSLAKDSVPPSYDLLEDYPGEGSDSGEKLQAAKKAIQADLQGIKDQYRMYESQLQQAQYEMRHNIFLLHAAKKVQALIDTASERQMDPQTMNRHIESIRREVAATGKTNGIYINLAELQSLRMLQGLVADEMDNNTPQSRRVMENGPASGFDYSWRETAPRSFAPVSPPKSRMIDETAPPLPAIVQETVPPKAIRNPFPLSDTMQSAKFTGNEDETNPGKSLKPPAK